MFLLGVSCFLFELSECFDVDADDWIVVSGTGAYACQLAKNVFRAGKVITTVSTAKVSRVPELLGEGVIDQSTSSLTRNLAFID